MIQVPIWLQWNFLEQMKRLGLGLDWLSAKVAANFFLAQPK